MDRLRLLIGSRHWLLLAALALISLALGTAIFSGASFTSKSANSASLAAGSVQISSSAPNQALVSATGMKPGDSKEGTVSIGNQGDVAGTVTLKANGLTGATLGAVIVLKIEDITGTASKKYEGKLASFSSIDLGSFAAGTTRKYRFTLSWPSSSNEAALQGLSVSLALQWEIDGGFTDASQNTVSASAVADWVAPTAEASVIGKSQGGAAGYIKKGGTYYVYARVMDAGNPASGVASVKADVHSITSGQTSVSLVAGSYEVDGASYNYRSTQLTAGGSLGSGSKSYALDLTDKAGNEDEGSFAVMVLAPFSGSGFDTANVSGGTEGKAEKGDSVSFEFNNAPEANTIVSGWTGSGTKSVTVSIVSSSSNDLLSVSGATIGSVELKGDFTESSSVTFSGSSMSLSGSTVTIVFGTSSGTAKTNTAKSKPVWAPSASIADLAANACSTSGVTGSNQKQF
jgi:spore coat-associated protein N